MVNLFLINYPVTGEANFTMECTGLTVGGFTQPSVARTLIEQHGSSEKGLCQRFLWVFPRPVFAKFTSLEPVHPEFTEAIGMCHVQLVESYYEHLYYRTVNITS